MPNFLKRNRHKNKLGHPEIVTGNFDLHFEDVIKKNRMAVITVLFMGLLAFAAFVPKGVDNSTAGIGNAFIEAENGRILNYGKINIVKDDSSAGGNSYIEFK